MKEEVKYKKIWNIAYPIILGSVATNVVNVTDTAFLGRVGEVALGGSAIGGIFYFILVMIGWGFGSGAQIIIARRDGENRRKEIGKIIEHSIYFLFPLSLVMFSILFFLTPAILPSIVKSPDITVACTDYLQYYSWGIIFSYFNISFRAFYVGLGKTRAVFQSTIIMALCNVVLDYLFIFGNYGFPELGIKGAALASAISEAMATVYFIIYTFAKVKRKKYRLFYFTKFSSKLLKKIVGISAPLMLQLFVSTSAWLIFFLCLEKMGEHNLAISNIIRSVYIVLMVPIWGFASAANTLVSNNIGKGRQHLVMHILNRASILCIVSVVVFVIAVLLFSKDVLLIYTSNISLVFDAQPVLYMVCAAVPFFGYAMILFHGVSGTGNTKTALVIEVSVIASYLLVVYLLSNVFNVSLQWVWTAEFWYAGTLTLISYLYLKKGSWAKKKI